MTPKKKQKSSPEEVVPPKDAEDSELKLELEDDEFDGLVEDIDEHDELGLDAEVEDETEDVPELDSIEELAEAESEAEDPTHDEEVEDDDDTDDDEVESALDDILRERFVVADLNQSDEEDDEGGDTLVRVRPRQPDEFVCQSCFLLKGMSQLADSEKMFCRDCV